MLAAALQITVGVIAAVIGIVLLFGGEWLTGLAFLCFGVAFANGALHGMWFCFHFHFGGDDDDKSDAESNSD